MNAQELIHYIATALCAVRARLMVSHPATTASAATANRYRA